MRCRGAKYRADIRLRGGDYRHSHAGHARDRAVTGTEGVAAVQEIGDLRIDRQAHTVQMVNWTLLISEIVLLATVSWGTLSIDRLLGLL